MCVIFNKNIKYERCGIAIEIVENLNWLVWSKALNDNVFMLLSFIHIRFVYAAYIIIDTCIKYSSSVFYGTPKQYLLAREKMT